MQDRYQKTECGHDSEGNEIERDKETGEILRGENLNKSEFYARFDRDLLSILNLED